MILSRFLAIIDLQGFRASLDRVKSIGLPFSVTPSGRGAWPRKLPEIPFHRMYDPPPTSPSFLVCYFRIGDKPGAI